MLLAGKRTASAGQDEGCGSVGIHSGRVGACEVGEDSLGVPHRDLTVDERRHLHAGD